MGKGRKRRREKAAKLKSAREEEREAASFPVCAAETNTSEAAKEGYLDEGPCVDAIQAHGGGPRKAAQCRRRPQGGRGG